MDFRLLTSKILNGEPARSEPFQQGMAAILKNRVDLSPVASPYQPGSVEDDAFFAGRMRAHNEFRNLLEEVKGDHAAAVSRMRELAAVREVA